VNEEYGRFYFSLTYYVVLANGAPIVKFEVCGVKSGRGFSRGLVVEGNGAYFLPCGWFINLDPHSRFRLFQEATFSPLNFLDNFLSQGLFFKQRLVHVFE
jgi:hypothetical protein